MGWYEDMIGGIADTYDGNSSTGGTTDWGSLGGDTGGGGWGKWVSNFFGGSSSGGSGGNIYSGLLAGLGSAADALISKEAVEEQGKQHRRSLDFQYQLEDFYKQKDKVRKRAALDTYGQFSTMNRWAPNAVAAPAIEQPAKPGY